MAKWEFTYIMQQRLCSGRSNKDSAEITNNIHEHATELSVARVEKVGGVEGAVVKNNRGHGRM